jgi:hypothetical protein
MAGDLAAYFDDLRMHRFTGSLARAPGFVGALVPGRRMAHRVVLARYVSASQPLIETGGYALRSASIALVALGADGVLRTGRVVENVRIPSGTVLDDKPLAWDSPLVRRVPSRVMRLVRWPGGRVHVATPAQVLDALAAIATQLAADSRRDLALLQRLLPPP